MKKINRLIWTLAQKILEKKDRKIVFCNTTFSSQRLELIKSLDTNFVIDVGANIGQWALELRKNRYQGQIVSLEPDKRAFNILKNNTSKDRLGKWKCLNFAAGANPEKRNFYLWNVEGGSSSFQKLSNEGQLFTHYNNSDLPYEKVEIVKLDDLFIKNEIEEKSIALKIDVQGFEMDVLKGASNLLKKTSLIDIELPISNVYKGGSDLVQVVNWLKEHNFQLCSLQTERWTGFGAADVDSLFLRRDLYFEMIKKRNSLKNI